MEAFAELALGNRLLQFFIHGSGCTQFDTLRFFAADAAAVGTGERSFFVAGVRSPTAVPERPHN